MSLSQWDGLAPVAATIALVVLALLPDRPEPTAVEADNRLNALEEAAAGQSVPWIDPGSGKSGVLIPTDLFQGDDGVWCRQYRINIAGQASRPSAVHVACRLAGGGWRDRPGEIAPARGAAPARGGQLAATPQ